jgi:hypothetical protein
MAITEVLKGSVNFARLAECQRDAREGKYEASMAGFVHWLAVDYPAVRDALEKERIELRDQFLNKYTHNRTPEVIANLLIGLRYFLRFAEAVGAIDQREREAHWERGMRAFRAIGERQAEYQCSADPVARFSEMIGTIISSGRGHIAGDDGQVPAVPPSPEFWGWQGREFRSGTDETSINYTPHGKKIGWVVGDELYLDPNATYAALVELGEEQGAPFPLTQQTLFRRLKDRGGLLLRTDKDRSTYPISLEGSRRRVLVFSATSLLQIAEQTGLNPIATVQAVPVSCPSFLAPSEKPGQQNSQNSREKRHPVPVVPVVPVSSTEGGARIPGGAVEASKGALEAASRVPNHQAVKNFDPSLSQKPGQLGQPGQTAENTEKNPLFSCPGFPNQDGKLGQETGTERSTHRLPATSTPTDAIPHAGNGHAQAPAGPPAAGLNDDPAGTSKRKRGRV